MPRLPARPKAHKPDSRSSIGAARTQKQLTDVIVAQPLMLRHVLKLLQHLCVHPVMSAVGFDNTTAVHAELQDWKSLLQTRTLWLPVLHAEGGCLSD